MKRKRRKRHFDGPVGPRLKALRVAKGMKLRDVADLLDVHLSLVCHWETGDGLPNVDQLAVLANEFDTTVADLIEGEKAFDVLSQLIDARAS